MTAPSLAAGWMQQLRNNRRTPELLGLQDRFDHE
jgi:hypothetical protein